VSAETTKPTPETGQTSPEFRKIIMDGMTGYVRCRFLALCNQLVFKVMVHLMN
jgi:hypothetical protein